MSQRESKVEGRGSSACKVGRRVPPARNAAIATESPVSFFAFVTHRSPFVIWPLILLWIFFTAPCGHAAGPEAAFEQGNRLYEEGKYTQAVAAYDQALPTGKVSAALLFNRGNALFKLGQTGRAIASYLQAERLSPRDPDLRANLQFARTLARGGVNYHADRWRAWLGSLTLNEWTLLTAAALWVLFVFLALGEWRPELRRTLRNYTAAAAFAVLFSGVCLAGVIDDDYITKSAVVITGEAEVRNGPLEESQTVYKVRDGAELTILDQKDGWFQVVDAAQRVGWLRQEQVLLLEPVVAPKAKS
ncbi:MAG TPA: tetratricopeptide repeat protein [Verrucomicrobiae bacterium]|nr:tetratricopeptide repeat protein [Verrucomicrobiae bacterium]